MLKGIWSQMKDGELFWSEIYALKGGYYMVAYLFTNTQNILCVHSTE